jgi:hypothetical protein
VRISCRLQTRMGSRTRAAMATARVPLMVVMQTRMISVPARQVQSPGPHPARDDAEEGVVQHQEEDGDCGPLARYAPHAGHRTARKRGP